VTGAVVDLFEELASVPADEDARALSEERAPDLALSVEERRS
jgi:hypothetical protein